MFSGAVNIEIQTKRLTIVQIAAPCQDNPASAVIYTASNYYFLQQGYVSIMFTGPKQAGMLIDPCTLYAMMYDV